MTNTLNITTKKKKKKKIGKEEELIIFAILIGRYIVVKFNGVYMV